MWWLALANHPPKHCSTHFSRKSSPYGCGTPLCSPQRSPSLTMWCVGLLFFKPVVFGGLKWVWSANNRRWHMYTNVGLLWNIVTSPSVFNRNRIQWHSRVGRQSKSRIPSSCNKPLVGQRNCCLSSVDGWYQCNNVEHYLWRYGHFQLHLRSTLSKHGSLW